MQQSKSLTTQYKELYYGSNSTPDYNPNIWQLIYRGSVVKSRATYAECSKKKFRLMKSNPLNYKKVFFNIKPITQ